jgi:anaerobic magnesium-protoporphyrin IX monomethyl ester cyclase
MKDGLDVVFVNADSSAAAYQGLADRYAAIEPPTWSLLLANSVRAVGFSAMIIDSTAERLSHKDSVERIMGLNPRLVVFVVYGQNPNSGTINMVGNTECAKLLKEASPRAVTCFVGSHTSALPHEVLALEDIDIVLLNEGVYALRNLLASNLQEDLRNIKGIGHKFDGKPVLNPPEAVVPNEKMDRDLPGYAWDLLPMREKPLDLYRAHFWHTEYKQTNRSPFAAIYTSLGCRYKCDFCMINIVNRVDNDLSVVSSNSPNMRFWSPEFMIRQFETLANLGVEHVRISDEMFFLNQRYFEPLLEGIISRGLNLNMWSYTRVDTVREKYLELFKLAGINWLAIGIEAGNREVRREVSKGTFKLEDISSVVKTVQDYKIGVAANYIFGFPDDTLDTMQQTLDLAIELNTEMANLYPCQALPGSPLHRKAKSENIQLPESYQGYGFLSYDSLPMATKHVSARDVVAFRDQAWEKYHTNPDFLKLIEGRFGVEAKQGILDLAKVKLKRKILGDSE